MDAKINTLRIKVDLTAAMKAGDALRVSVLRMLLSELNYKKIDLGRELTDEDAIGVLQKEAKKRREAIASYTAGRRTEQAESEGRELAILTAYLPQQMSEEEVRAEIHQEMQKVGQPADFGAAMKVFSPMFRGKADGGMVARLVKEELGL